MQSIINTVLSTLGVYIATRLVSRVRVRTRVREEGRAGEPDTRSLHRSEEHRQIYWGGKVSGVRCQVKKCGQLSAVRYNSVVSCQV